MFITSDNGMARTVGIRPWGTRSDQALVIGSILLVLTGPDDADELIRAATAAKSRMLAFRAAGEDGE